MQRIPSTILLTLFACLLFSACSDTVSSENESQLEVRTASDIGANADAERGAPPDYTFYSFRQHGVVAEEDSASDQWDIAFSSTNILVNSGASGPGSGGAIMLDIAFDEVDMAPSDGYETDTGASRAITDWYNYTGNSEPAHAVIPKENLTIVLRTADGGHYVKMEILSYYEGNPDTSTDEFADMQTRPDDRYYTFRYAIQLNGSRELN